MTDNQSHMTTKTRVVVRLLDTYTGELANGTDFERSVGVLLGQVATVIVNDQVGEAALAIEHHVAWQPRADKVALEQEAEMVAEDAADLRGLEGEG